MSTQFSIVSRQLHLVDLVIPLIAGVDTYRLQWSTTVGGSYTAIINASRAGYVDPAVASMFLVSYPGNFVRIAFDPSTFSISSDDSALFWLQFVPVTAGSAGTASPARQVLLAGQTAVESDLTLVSTAAKQDIANNYLATIAGGGGGGGGGGGDASAANQVIANGYLATIASSPAPTGVATEAKQDVANAYLATIASSPAPTGVATAAKQDTEIASLASLDTKQPSKGTAVMTGSSPVTIATDDTLMAAIKADVDKIPSKGTAVMTGSAPVTIATDDTLMAAIKNSVNAIPAKGTAVMTGSSPVTIATDDTLTVAANASLAAIKTDVDKIPSKGTAVMTGSTPVTIATDDTLMTAIKTDVDKIPSKGTAVMTGSTPVTIATDDTLTLAIKNSVNAIPAKGTAVMTGSTPVTIATDDTLMAAIKTDVDKIPSKGTAVMTGSTPVTISTDDTVLTGLSGKFAAAATPGAAGAIPSTTIVSAIQRYLNAAGSGLDSGQSGIITAVSAVLGWANQIVGAVYRATPPTLTDGQVYSLQGDISGFLRSADQYGPQAEDNTNGVIAVSRKLLGVNTYAPSLQTNFGAATKANTKASTGNVLGIVVTNTNAAGRWFLLHNKATAPVATDVPLYAFWVGPSVTLAITEGFFVGSGGNFTTGIGWAWSTTVATFTDGGTAGDHTMAIHYK